MIKFSCLEMILDSIIFYFEVRCTMKKINLNNKTILVTGSSGFIGLSMYFYMNYYIISK